MISILLEDKNIATFEKALQDMAKKCQSILVLSCADNHFAKEQIDPILKQITIPIIGGVFPAIVYHDKQYEEGTILVGLQTPLDVTILENISQERDYATFVEKQVGRLDPKTESMFLFFDATSTYIDTIIQALFTNYGLTLNYMGGSAGNKDFLPCPTLFSNQGLLEDCALIATTTARSTIGVKHGWEAINETRYHITKAKGKVIYELDYQPALEVYKKVLKENLDITIDETNLFDTASSFPLGIKRLSGAIVVRVPNETNKEGTLICTGEVYENSYVQILHANNQQLIDAAQQASLSTKTVHYAKSFNLYIGCLARLFVMQDEFPQELNAIYQQDELLVGALSLGEIANNQDHYLELYNSTAVFAKIEDD